MKKLLTSLPPLLCIVALLLVAGCRKERDSVTEFTWYGKVMEYGTQKPVPNVKLRLYPYVGGVADSTTADANGNYRLTLHNYNPGRYFFYPAVDRWQEYYYPSEGFTPSGFSNSDTEAKLDIVLQPYGSIRYHIKNVSPFDSNDYINLWTFITYGSQIGMQIDTTILETYLGNRILNMTWSVTKNGTVNYFKDSLYIPAHDTIDYEILY